MKIIVFLIIIAIIDIAAIFAISIANKKHENKTYTKNLEYLQDLNNKMESNTTPELHPEANMPEWAKDLKFGD